MQSPRMQEKILVGSGYSAIFSQYGFTFLASFIPNFSQAQLPIIFSRNSISISCAILQQNRPFSLVYRSQASIQEGELGVSPRRESELEPQICMGLRCAMRVQPMSGLPEKRQRLGTKLAARERRRTWLQVRQCLSLYLTSASSSWRRAKSRRMQSTRRRLSSPSSSRTCLSPLRLRKKCRRKYLNSDLSPRFSWMSLYSWQRLLRRKKSPSLRGKLTKRFRLLSFLLSYAIWNSPELFTTMLRIYTTLFLTQPTAIFPLSSSLNSMCCATKLGFLSASSTKRASTRERPRMGSIGSRSRICPTAVISSWASRASMILRVSMEVWSPWLSGGEMQENENRSLMPRDLSRRTTVSRLEFSISGTLPSGRARKLSSEQRRKQKPGAVLPARPARCLADDWLICRSFMEEYFSFWLQTSSQSSPGSTTTRTSSMVMAVSAMREAKMSLWRLVWLKALRCSSGRILPWRGQTSKRLGLRNCWQWSVSCVISSTLWQNTSTCPLNGERSELFSSITYSSSTRLIFTSVDSPSLSRQFTLTSCSLPDTLSALVFPKYRSNSSTSMEAEVMMTLKSGLLFTRPLMRPAMTSMLMVRSWASSMTRQEQLESSGSSESSSSTMRSSLNTIFAQGLTCFSIELLQSTNLPSFSPSSEATRSARVRVASLLG